ncbi:MAG: hypothetical protein ACE5EZ_03070 [Thermodesulfobacteriota bacterium]
MKSMKKSWFNLIIVFVCALGLISLFGGAASGNEAGGWKWKAEAGMGLTLDTNVYKFSSSQSDRFDANSTSDQMSGRYEDMDSESDFIFTPQLKATFKRPGLGGRTFSVRPSVAYNVYSKNMEKNFFEFGIGLRQQVEDHASVGLELDYAPNIFKKNYLSGAADKDLTFSVGLPTSIIQDNEEIFSPAHYDKTKITVDYSRRLWKSAKSAMTNLELEKVSGRVLAGYESKSYDAPFAVRDEGSLFAGFDVKLALYKDTAFTFSYLFKSIDTDVGTEMLIRDEPDFAVDLNGDGIPDSFDTVADLNGDGDSLDINVPTLQNVDRSRNQHSLGVKASTKIGEGWKGYAKYEVRFASYKSEERFDVTRVDRTDTRQKVGLGIKGELAPRWTMDLGWTLTHNEASREGLAVVDKAEAKSYNKHVFAALVSYRF